MNIDVGKMCVADPKLELVDEYQFPASQAPGEGSTSRYCFKNHSFRDSFSRVTYAARQIAD
jgi:hypothetical protein